jgi:RNA-dependent RNA polymerase
MDRDVIDVIRKVVPSGIYNVDVLEMRLFTRDSIDDVSRWIKTLGWKNAFQIEACLRCGLLNTHELLSSLRKPIEAVIIVYGSGASEILRLFSVALWTRSPSETPNACLTRILAEYPTIKPLTLPKGHILCHQVIITPSRILPQGPFVMPSNRLIQHFQSHDPTLIDRFMRVEFRDEDNLAYRWDEDVDRTSFLYRRVGGILREGFEFGGQAFEFLAHSMGSLREHAVWFVAPFRDPVAGFVNAESIWALFGSFSKLRTPSKCAERVAQALEAMHLKIKILSYQWEEQDDLGPHTDGVGTISQELAHNIWKQQCKTAGNRRKDHVMPFAYQFRFLWYEGVVVIDSLLKGIKLRLRKSQRRFPVYDVDVVEGELEILRSFNCPSTVYLNRHVALSLVDVHSSRESLGLWL